MSCFKRAAWDEGLEWIRCSGGVALPGADPKTAATGLAPKQMAPNPQSDRAIRCPVWGVWFLLADLLWCSPRAAVLGSIKCEDCRAGFARRSVCRASRHLVSAPILSDR